MSIATSLCISVINIILSIVINLLIQREYFYELSEYYATYTKYLAVSQFLNVAVCMTIAYKFIEPDKQNQLCQVGGVFQ